MPNFEDEAVQKSLASNLTFGITGVVYVTMVQWLDYEGIGTTEAGLTLLSIFLGCVVVGAPLLFQDRAPRRLYSHVFVVLAALNLLGELAGQLCVVYVGSGVFIILYSSVTVFAALIKWRWFGVALSMQQWGSVWLITAALCVQSAGSATNSDGGAHDKRHHNDVQYA